MTPIHVARGVGVAPTAMAAYDAALADINLHNYNLVTVSSVIPADGDLRVVDAAPDLGPAGNRLFVVQGKSVAKATDSQSQVATAVGWATGPGPGLFYEVSGSDPAAVETEVHRGLDAGCELRDWTVTNRDVCVSSAETAPSGYTAAVVVAAYGESEPIC